MCGTGEGAKGGSIRVTKLYSCAYPPRITCQFGVEDPGLSRDTPRHQDKITGTNIATCSGVGHYPGALVSAPFLPTYTRTLVRQLRCFSCSSQG